MFNSSEYFKFFTEANAYGDVIYYSLWPETSDFKYFSSFSEILLKGQGDWDTQTSYSLKLGDVFHSEPENKRSDQVEWRSDGAGVPGGGSLRSEARWGLRQSWQSRVLQRKRPTPRAWPVAFAGKNRSGWWQKRAQAHFTVWKCSSVVGARVWMRVQKSVSLCGAFMQVTNLLPLSSINSFLCSVDNAWTRPGKPFFLSSTMLVSRWRVREGHCQAEGRGLSCCCTVLGFPVPLESGWAKHAYPPWLCSASQ